MKSKSDQLSILLRRFAPLLFTIVLLFVGIFFFFRPILTSSFHESQSGIGDTILNNFFLEHSFKMITDNGYSGSWWSPLFFYPQSNTLTYSDNLWGIAPLYWLFRYIFLPLTAFQLWMIVLAIFNYISFYLLSRSLRINVWFSSVGAFLFSFCLPSIMQLGHQQLLPRFYSVFAILFLYKYLENKKLSHFILFEIFAYLQLLAGVYLGWFLIFTSPILIITYAAYHKDRPLLKSFLNYKIVAAILLFSIAIIATMKPYINTQAELGGRTYDEVQTMIPSIISYLNFPSESIFHTIYPSLIENKAELLPMRHEQYLFLGVFLPLLFIFALLNFLRMRDKSEEYFPPLFTICISIFAILTLLSTRIPLTDLSLWKGIYQLVPGVEAIRAVARIWTISYIFLFIGVTTLVSSVFSKTSSKYTKSALFILAVLACIEQINLAPNFFSKDQQLTIQSQITTTIEKAAENNNFDAFYLQWPQDQSYIPFQTKAVWASLELNIPTVNGYSGNVPHSYKTIEAPMSVKDIDLWLKVSGKLPRTQKILFLNGSIQNGTFKVATSSVISLPSDKE